MVSSTSPEACPPGLGGCLALQLLYGLLQAPCPLPVHWVDRGLPPSCPLLSCQGRGPS